MVEVRLSRDGAQEERDEPNLHLPTTNANTPNNTDSARRKDKTFKMMNPICTRPAPPPSPPQKRVHKQHITKAQAKVGGLCRCARRLFLGQDLLTERGAS